MNDTIDTTLPQTVNAREQRGLLIAATMRIRRNGDAWSVPSQTVNGNTYTVTLMGESPKCSCPDHEKRQDKCKHIFAVEFSLRRETRADGTTKVTRSVRMTYKQDWKSYSAAQCNEKERAAELLRALCNGIQQPEQKRGRPRLPLSDVVFAATMKVFTTMSGRRADSDLRECQNKGQITAKPHYNSIFAYLENPALTSILKTLIEESAAPLKSVERDFAIDSSGFSSSVFDRWYEEKYGRIKGGRVWLKTHLMCGVTTNIVTSVEITGPEIGDAGQLPQLLHDTQKRFQVAEVSADKGYLSKKNMETIDASGAVPFIAFKTGSIGDNGCAIWGKMFHYFQFRKEDFLAHYHKRSNVETTFSMVKRKFGSSVRSKSKVAQTNEVLCKVLCHNLCILVKAIYELKIEATFWSEA